MTTGIIAGHGWHDNVEFIVLPPGVRLGFYASPESGLDFAVMEETIRRGNVAPLEYFDPGTNVPNYTYEQFSDLEMARVIQANTHDLPLTFIEGRTQLCTNTAVCAGLPQHTCDGVLGRAAAQGWDAIHVFACRINTVVDVAPTNEIKDQHGNPTTEYHDEWKEWIRSFLVLPIDAQDTAWSQMPPGSQAVLGADLEMREWAECYWLRMELIAAPGRESAILGRVGDALKARLFRDYPAFAHLNTFNPLTSPGYAGWIANFNTLGFQDKVTEWESLVDVAKTNVLVDPNISLFARQYKVWTYFKAGLEPAFLDKMLEEFHPADRALLRAQPGFPAAAPPASLPYFQNPAGNTTHP